MDEHDQLDHYEEVTTDYTFPDPTSHGNSVLRGDIVGQVVQNPMLKVRDPNPLCITTGQLYPYDVRIASAVEINFDGKVDCNTYRKKREKVVVISSV